MSAVLFVHFDVGNVDGVGNRADQVGDLRPEARGQHRERARAADWRQVVGVVFDRVVQQCRADDVRVMNVVVDDDPERDAEQVVDERLALAVVECVEPSGELQRLLDLAASGRVAESCGLGGEPFAQSAFAVESRDRVERHPLDDAALDDVARVVVGVSRPCGGVAAFAALPTHGDLADADTEFAFEDVR